MIGQHEPVRLPRQKLDHEWVVGVSRLMKPKKLPLAVALFPGLISARFQESGESSCEVRVDDFDTQNHVQVFGCSERKSGFFEEEIAGGPSNQRVLLFVSSEVLAKLLYAGYRASRSKRSAAAAAMRSFE